MVVLKNQVVEDLRDFCPINLMQQLYKLLAKVLANRPRRMVGKVVSNFSHEFVEKRPILDKVIIATKPLALG